MEQIEKLKVQLEEHLSIISKTFPILTQQAKESIPVCIQALDQLKIRITKKPFKSKEDEIYFFKHIKPQINAKLIYYIQLFNIESRKPSGPETQLKLYFSGHLKIINQFINDNIEFYKYCRSGSIFLDEKYFIREKADLHLILDSHFVNYDTTFNTSHDHKLGQIIAFDLLTIYLYNQLNKLERNFFSETPNNPIQPAIQLKWTDSKTSLIELIYALNTQGVFDNGKADIKEIAACFENIFNIDLGDYYRTYLEIRVRKIGRTKFLDLLKENFSKRMDGQDEK